MYTMPNLRIIGGIPAYTFSWPTTALIYFTFATDVVVNGQTELFRFSTQCTGTLVDRTTVLVAAQQCYLS